MGAVVMVVKGRALCVDGCCLDATIAIYSIRQRDEELKDGLN